MGIFDFKKEYKDLYLPKAEPVIVDVPGMRFLAVHGAGDPNESGGEYSAAVEALYGLSYAIKMSYKGNSAPKGYFEYVVAPLEGLWWTEGETFFDPAHKEQLCWTSLLRQPDFVTESVLQWAKEQLQKKKKVLDLSKVVLWEFTEGLCVQMMHLGPYDEEPKTVKAIDDYAASRGYRNAITEQTQDGTIRRHHEIYLSNPLQTEPHKLKTVVRHPISK